MGVLCFGLFSNATLSSRGEERTDCFTLIVFLMYCCCQCSVAPPYDVVGLSAVYDCGISNFLGVTSIQIVKNVFYLYGR